MAYLLTKKLVSGNLVLMDRPDEMSASQVDALVEQAVALLRQATYPVALTGAGVSTPSGIPDFRSREVGLWNQVDPMAVASLSAFRRQPQRFYDWMRPLARTLMEAEPNPAHQALASLEAAGYLKSIITQNIDGLHQRAGSQVVHEVHGHVRSASCMRCGRVQSAADLWALYSVSGQVPRCACGGLMKPDAVLFGELLPAATLDAALAEIDACDLVLVAGSSLQVEPVAGMPRQAAWHGARVIIVNFEPTYLDASADVVIHKNVAHILPRIAGRLVDNDT